MLRRDFLLLIPLVVEFSIHAIEYRLRLAEKKTKLKIMYVTLEIIARENYVKPSKILVTCYEEAEMSLTRKPT